MTTQQTADPEAPAYVERRGRHWKVFILCPWCSDVHRHSGGPVSQPPDLENRAAHCLVAQEPMRGYSLVAGPKGMAKLERLPYRERQRLLAEDDRKRGFAYRNAVVGR